MEKVADVFLIYVLSFQSTGGGNQSAQVTPGDLEEKIIVYIPSPIYVSMYMPEHVSVLNEESIVMQKNPK